MKNVQLVYSLCGWQYEEETDWCLKLKLVFRIIHLVGVKANVTEKQKLNDLIVRTPVLLAVKRHTVCV